LVDEDAADPAAGAQSDPRYFGPFGAPPDAYRQAAPPEAVPGPLYAAQHAPAWPAPESVAPVLAPPPPAAAAARRSEHGPGRGAVVAIAAAVALLIGGGAGYAGAQLAQLGAPSAAASVSAVPTRAATPSSTAGPTATASPEAVPPAPPTLDTVAVVKRSLPGTVMIQAGRGTGSGFVLDAQGRIMTNNHVVAGAADGSTIRVIFADGRRLKAELVGRSPSYDLAVIKVKASTSLKPIAIGNSDQSQVGQPVIALGSPLGLLGTVTQGIVSARHRPVLVRENGNADSPIAYIDAIQTDAPINPGNSGGPLVDAGARVIGINSAILTFGNGQPQVGSIGLGFAIPINQAMTIGRQLIRKGRATYPVIGASLRDTSDGIALIEVDRQGPAGKAGLREGDLIARIDDRRVEAMEELIVSIRTRRPGDKVVLEYVRGGRPDRATVTLGSKVG